MQGKAGEKGIGAQVEGDRQESESIEDGVCKAAKSPHELFMINLAFFHLLLGPGAIILIGGGQALLLPVTLSMLVIGYSAYRSRALPPVTHELIRAHWWIAMRRYRILLLGYLLTGAILLVGKLVGMGATSAVGRDIVFTIFSRFGVMPVVITVFVCLVLESSALFQATNGQLPPAWLKRQGRLKHGS
jgi:hypothetical protein